MSIKITVRCVILSSLFLYAAACDTFEIIKATALIGAVYGGLESISQIVMYPDYIEQGVQRFFQENPGNICSYDVVKGLLCAAVVAGSSAKQAVRLGGFMGAPLVFATKNGLLQSLTMGDIIKPLVGGLACVWAASMIKGRIAYDCAYKDPMYANESIRTFDKNLPLRDVMNDNDELLKCKSSLLVALHERNKFANRASFLLSSGSIGLVVWANSDKLALK